MNGSNILRCLTLPHQMFAGNTEAYTSRFEGRLLIMLVDIKQGWKDLPGSNTLAYFSHLTVTKLKTS
jgi:hypothetical protein